MAWFHRIWKNFEIGQLLIMTWQRPDMLEQQEITEMKYLQINASNEEILSQLESFCGVISKIKYMEYIHYHCRSRKKNDTKNYPPQTSNKIRVRFLTDYGTANNQIDNILKIFM